VDLSGVGHRPGTVKNIGVAAGVHNALTERATNR
jgi:hypothetical protein